MPERDRRVQFRNRYLMMVKNDTLQDVERDVQRIATYEMAALGYAAIREPHLLGGYRDALRLLPEARRKGRLIQERRRERGFPRAPFGLEPSP
jgi:hypothetical protein